MENKQKDVKPVAKATSTKKKKQEKSRILEVLTKEYKYENLILGILALIVAILALYLIGGDLAFSTSEGFFSFLYNREKLVGWILLLFSVGILLSLLIPFFKPSFDEVSKVTFPDKKEMRIQIARVFAFIILFSVFFVGMEVFFRTLLIDWLKVVK